MLLISLRMALMKGFVFTTSLDMWALTTKNQKRVVFSVVQCIWHPCTHSTFKHIDLIFLQLAKIITVSNFCNIFQMDQAYEFSN